MAETPVGLHEDGSFRFHVPFDLKKGSDGRTWIEGIASVEKEDLTGETVILAGMDLSYLLSRGYFNDNHAKTTDAKVGVPTEAHVSPSGLKVKGYLFDTPRAQGIVELAEALQKSGSNRRLGFSVEGKTLKRDGKIIKQSWIKDIAITAEPVNTETYLDIVKSISADIAANGYVDDVESESMENDAPPLTYWSRLEQIFTNALKRVLGGGGLEKMLTAGTENPPEAGGSVLRKESLEEEMTNLDIPGEGQERNLTFEQAVQILVDKGWTEDSAREVVKKIFGPTIRRFIVEAYNDKED